MINPTTPYTTIRIWKETLRLLRIAAARNEENMVQTLDRLVRQEYERTQEIEPRISSKKESLPGED